MKYKQVCVVDSTVNQKQSILFQLHEYIFYKKFQPL